MILTPELVALFAGGQMEIQNEGEGYLYRGEILTISIEGDELHVQFFWVAKGEGYPPFPLRWVNGEGLDYRAFIGTCAVSNIGPSGGDISGGDRLCIVLPIIGEIVILYPPDGSKLDSSKVFGLVLPTKPR